MRDGGEATGGDWRDLSPPRFLLNSIFCELKKIILKRKIVQNYKAR